MEAAFLTLDMIIMLLLVFWYAQNERNKPGTPLTGLFRYLEGRHPTPHQDQPPKYHRRKR